MLFEMLTGHVPFEGESVGEVLMKHLTAEPDLSRLGEPYRDIVRRTLAKDPDQRLKSVGEMVALLPGGEGAPSVPPSGVRNAHSAKQAGPQADAAAAAFGDLPPWHESEPDQIEEPIWKAIRDGYHSLISKWHSDEVQHLNPLKKALLVFAMVGICIFSAEWLIALAVPLAICYAIYFVIWKTVIRPSMVRNAKQLRLVREGTSNARSQPIDMTVDFAVDLQSPEQPMSPATRYAHQVRQRRKRPSWRERANQELAAKPLRDKATELLGSMLMATVVALLAALLAPILITSGSSSDRLAIYLWLAAVGTLGSWAILVPAKFVEGRLEDQVPMRILLMVLGGLVGLAAWFLASTLFVHVPGWNEPVQMDVGLLSQEMLEWPQSPGTDNPSLSHYVAYFAFLFVLLRWWRQAESTRYARLSMWSVLVCLFWAWLLHIFWWFPQPTGILAAGVIAMSIQLASPWMPPSQRRALQTEVEQA
jgi:hypothetical protein